MTFSERTDDEARPDDERATERPANDPESEPAEQRDPDPGEASGPLGNPGSDEEALRHRQQESDGER